MSKFPGKFKIVFDSLLWYLWHLWTNLVLLN